MKSMLLSYGSYILMGAPIIMSILIYSLGMKVTNNQWKSIHKSVQWSAIFYVIAVELLVKTLFNIRLIGYIVILLILVAAYTLVMQWKQGKDVELLTGLRIMWRVSFLLFSFVYCGLVIYIIVYYVVL